MISQSRVGDDEDLSDPISLSEASEANLRVLDKLSTDELKKRGRASRSVASSTCAQDDGDSRLGNRSDRGSREDDLELW